MQGWTPTTRDRVRLTWKIPLFPIHQPGEFFLISPAWEANFGENFFSLESTNFTRASCHFFFFFLIAIYNKTITLNLEHTFFLWETFIYNDVSDSFFFVERCQLNLIKTKNILD